MARTFEKSIGPRQSAALLAVTLVAGGGSLAALLAVSDGLRSLVTWCRTFVIAATPGDGALAIALAAAVLATLAVSALSVLAFLAAEALAARRFALALRRRSVPVPSRVRAAAAQAGLANVTVVRDDAPFAATVGLLRPAVAVSTAMVSRLTLAELRAVLAHERAHCRGLHPLRAVAWESFRRAFFFLPVLDDVCGHFALRRELVADRDAVASVGTRPLASALLKAVAARQPVLPAAAAAFGHLPSRIAALAGGRGATLRVSASRSAMTVAAVAGIVLANGLLASAAMARTSDDGPRSCGAPHVLDLDKIMFSPYFAIRVQEPESSREMPDAPKRTPAPPVQSTDHQP